jgi:hypothetical protein
MTPSPPVRFSKGATTPSGHIVKRISGRRIVLGDIRRHFATRQVFLQRRYTRVALAPITLALKASQQSPRLAAHAHTDIDVAHPVHALRSRQQQAGLSQKHFIGRAQHAEVGRHRLEKPISALAKGRLALRIARNARLERAASAMSALFVCCNFHRAHRFHSPFHFFQDLPATP